MVHAGIKSALLSGLIACLSACNGATATKEQENAPPWKLSEHKADILKASCPADLPVVEPETVSLHAEDIELGDKSVQLEGFEFKAGYVLTSEDSRFGGLSGVDAISSTRLLSVSDDGAFVWLDLDDSGTRPVSARMSSLRDGDGRALNGKVLVDAEGVSVIDGLTFVSFERNHRVVAYAPEVCGAMTRAVPVYSKVDDANAPKTSANKGIEALGIDPDGGLIMGLESRRDGKSLISLTPQTGLSDFQPSLLSFDFKALTGVDVLKSTSGSTQLYSLHRAYDPVRGVRVSVLKTPMTADRVGGWHLGTSVEIANLKPPARVDNFEAISAVELADGKVRLFLISDNNFSENQSTLLYIFESVEEDRETDALAVKASAD